MKRRYQKILCAGAAVVIALVAALFLRGDKEQPMANAPRVFSVSSPVFIPLGISVVEAAALPQGIALAPGSVEVRGPSGDVAGAVKVAVVEEEGEYGLSVTPGLEIKTQNSKQRKMSYLPTMALSVSILNARPRISPLSLILRLTTSLGTQASIR